MLAQEVNCELLADAIADEIRYRLDIMGIEGVSIEAGTLHVWIRIVARADGASWSKYIDTATLGECGRAFSVAGELSLEIARWHSDLGNGE